MLCIPRLIRPSTLQRSVSSFVKRNLTSNSVSITTPTISAIPQIKLINNDWIYQENDKIKSPLTNKVQIELPNGLRWIPPSLEDPEEKTQLEMPTVEGGNSAIEAARLIVIRRNKMKRHKLKKLRKRMKYERAKIRQRRELKKEKAFQAILIQQCKTAEAFSAEQYVEERLKKLKELSIDSNQDAGNKRKNMKIN